MKPLCPSADLPHAFAVLGLVAPDATVELLPTPTPLDEALRAGLSQLARPEKHFRLLGPCHRQHCQQWQNGGCGIARQVAALPVTAEPPPCSLRGQCRWHLQEGLQACRVCPLIRTDNA